MAYKKEEHYEERVTSGLIEKYRDSLELLGENPEREGLLKTPERMAKAMQYLTQGYQMDAKAILESAKFHEEVSEMIIVKDIELFSMCEHHMLPFFGKAHVAYIPNGYITGLSKIARVVDVYSRRLQVQERLTQQILTAIKDSLNPLGVAVVIEAKHLCMMMRGVQKQNSVTTTSAFWGEFEKPETRSEFTKLISNLLNWFASLFVGGKPFFIFVLLIRFYEACICISWSRVSIYRNGKGAL
jgi:GTP cyclohydrolase IA